ncbi:glycosyltransferase [Vibrio splendidus]|uniref:glycosyltransferase n=1 Tax=Vibrio splendidus TaxID=29497 RepID=UPI000C84962E|nr:glycosyltransferase [Vibrio splendidus]PMH70890.1 hypothetical protein BCU61_06175 [Vibrio splendidus]
MINLKYIIDVTDKNKAGLFYSVLERISRTREKNVVFNLSFYDSWLVSRIKRIFNIKSKERKNTFYYNNVEVQPIHLKRGIFDYLFIAIGLTDIVRMFDAKKIISKENISNKDIIYAHWGVSSGLIGHYLKKLVSCKLIICYHGSDIHTIPVKRKDIRHCLLKALKNADINVFVSHALFQSAKSLGYEEDNYKVIYNGVEDLYGVNTKNIEVKNFIKKYGLNIKNNSHVIGYIGNLKHVKGADLLPQITKEIAWKLPECTFVVAGDGELRKKIQDSCVNTTFIGHIERNDVALLLGMLDVLILPSRNEGLPLIIAEAKKCGVAVVASNVGGVNEILERENCISFDDDFVNKFSYRTVKLIDNGSINKPLSDSFLWESIITQESKMISGIRSGI